MSTCKECARLEGIFLKAQENYRRMQLTWKRGDEQRNRAFQKLHAATNQYWEHRQTHV